MKQIRVNVSKPYDVIVEKGSINDVATYIGKVCRTDRLAVITDDVVDGLYGAAVEDNLAAAGFEVYKFVFKNGEESKNISTLSDILEFLASNLIRRNDTLIALGGGVTGDITGLAAALYMRGMNVVQIPTTLLAMVDSSVGGKTAVDLANGKNMAGAFWQPAMVVCDPDIAVSLPDRIFADGMAEVIKCNVIKKLPVIDYISSGTLKEHLQETIEACIELKRDVVQLDEFDEKGIRNILNVGHTVAHAIEKLSGYTVSHGIAVGTGLIKEAEIAEMLGICGEETLGAIRAAVNKYGLSYDIRWNSEEIADAMKSDKKNRDFKIVFELPHSLGNCEEYKLSREELVAILKKIFYREGCQ